MMFKNSMKLLCANFDKVWKLLLYQLLSWLLIFALLAPFYDVYSSILLEVWKSFGLAEVFTSGTFYGISVSISDALSKVLGSVLEFVKLLFQTHIGAGIYFAFIIFLVRPFLADIGKFTTCEMMYGFMAASSKQSFTGTALRTLGKSSSYAGIKFLFTIPFNALIGLGIFGIASINNPIFAYAMPFLIIILPALLFAFKETFISGWAAAMIVYDCNVFKAFPKGMKAMFRRGMKVYSTAFIIYLLALILSIVIGLYALIIILPVLFPLLYIFEMVMFFSSQGMRFYVDADTVLSPKKLEEVDKIENSKYLL